MNDDSNKTKNRNDNGRHRHHRKKNVAHKIREKCNFFYNNIEDIEAQRQSKSQFATKQTPVSMTLTNESSNGYCEYFDPTSRHAFMEEYAILNSTLSNEEIEYKDAEDQFVDDDDEYGLDFQTLFTFGCSPTARDKELQRRGITADNGFVPAISDIRKSSLSYMNNGRIQIRLPSDRVRLLMDDHMEAGILSVERPLVLANETQESASNDTQERTSPLLKPRRSSNDSIIVGSQQVSCVGDDTEINVDEYEVCTSSLPELNYVLTVDEDLYRRVLSEIVDSRTPCGLYFCCHDYDSKSVNIKVAIGILVIVFSLLLWGTITWPTG
jgi:hypothetical protein